MRYFFGVSAWLLLPVAPAVSMRLLSEEMRAGTIEPLMTAPVSDASVVVGKYLGAAAFLAAMFVPSLVVPAILAMAADPRPDAGPIVAGYLSLVLLGLLYLAAGVLASALTSNQTLAFLATLLGLLLVLLVTTVGAENASLPEWAQRVLASLSLSRRVADFAKGVIDTGHVVFFLGGTVWLLVLAVAALGSRRWL